MEKKNEVKFAVRDREAGNVIEVFRSLSDAELALAQYEQDDKDNDVYSENFYEIVKIEEEN